MAVCWRAPLGKNGRGGIGRRRRQDEPVYHARDARCMRESSRLLRRCDPSEAPSLLVISNGHGEDECAVSILKEIRKLRNVETEAMPIVGVGRKYSAAGIRIASPTQALPSGGFVYLRPLMLLRDILGGLLPLTIRQVRSLKAWVEKVQAKSSPCCILAVGDIVPLALAVLAATLHNGAGVGKGSLGFVFVGCAKSNYYLSEEFRESKCVYYPWERRLLSHPSCRLIAPRDDLTSRVLRSALPAHPQKVMYLGNPMMDPVKDPSFDLALTRSLRAAFPGRDWVTLLPGTRDPEVYRNTTVILKVCAEAIYLFESSQTLAFMFPVPSSCSITMLANILEDSGWKKDPNTIKRLSTLHVFRHSSSDGHTVLVLSRDLYRDALTSCDAAVAMAGTATEQCAGLGHPVVTLPGNGPQFNKSFARAQQKLLGEKSIKLADSVHEAALSLQSALMDPQVKADAKQNGQERMGAAGASGILAKCVVQAFSPGRNSSGTGLEGRV